jgi:hypothetical protein
MKRYCIKCEPGRVEFLEVLRQTESGYSVRVTRVKDGWDQVVEQTMPAALFETCLKTGYIYEEAAAAAHSVA